MWQFPVASVPTVQIDYSAGVDPESIMSSFHWGPLNRVVRLERVVLTILLYLYSVCFGLLSDTRLIQCHIVWLLRIILKWICSADIT